MIGNKTDLGAVPQLWGKPQTYARFLGAELRFVYKDTLLVVMPQGFGINGPFPLSGARRAARHRPAQGPDAEGLTDSADKALRALAKADGRTVSGGSGGGGGGGCRCRSIAAGVMVLAGIGGGVLILRGDRKSRAGKARPSAARRSAGVSASPGAGRSLQSTSTDGSPRARAPCSPSCGSCAQSARGIATGWPLRPPP